MLLKKRLVLLIVMCLFLTILISAFASAEMCEVAHVRDNLRKMLYEYFETPHAAKMELGKVKDLLNFYLSIPTGEFEAECSGIGANSQVSYYLIVNEGKNLTTAIPYCSDGTQFGTCSSTKPFYCYNGRLVDRCTSCGCPAGKLCQNNLCAGTAGNATCKVNSDCGVNTYIGDYYCKDGDVYRERRTYFCVGDDLVVDDVLEVEDELVVGEGAPYCYNSTPSVLIDDCGINEMCIEGQSECQTVGNQSDINKSDLVVTDIIMAPLQPVAGGNVNITLVVKNIGTVKASAGELGYQINMVHKTTRKALNVGAYMRDFSLDAGGTYNINKAVQLSNLDLGEHYISAAVDTMDPSGMHHQMAWIDTNGSFSNYDLTAGNVAELDEYYNNRLIETFTLGNVTLPIGNQTVFCSDSDGGIVYDIKGLITAAAGLVAVDNCPWEMGSSTNRSILSEWYCKADGVKAYVSYICPFNCSNGACLSSPVANATQFCSDSDGGFDYEIKGSITTTSGLVAVDNCPWEMGSSTNRSILSEWYCKADGTKAYVSYKCSFNCSNGACLSGSAANGTQFCSDSDGGIDYEIKGSITTASGLVAVDNCPWEMASTTNKSALSEWYCKADGTKAYVPYSCLFGCANGACLNGTG